MCNLDQYVEGIKQYLDIVKEVDNMDKGNTNVDDIDIYDDEFLTSSVSELNGVFYKMKKIGVEW